MIVVLFKLDDAAKRVVCIHTLTMALVDIISDRVTELTWCNTSENTFVVKILQRFETYLKSRQCQLPSSLDKLSTMYMKSSVTYDTIISDFIADYNANNSIQLDPSYNTHLKTKNLSRKQRSIYKIKEFYIRSEKTDDMQNETKETFEQSNLDTRSTQFTNEVHLRVTNAIQSIQQQYKYDAVVYSSKIISELLEIPQVRSKLERQNPVMFNAFMDIVRQL